jgi:hypothetical protein
MHWAQLVIAIGDYEDRAGSLNAPADVPQEVERGSIRPMQVLQHNEANALGSGQILKETPKQSVTGLVIAPALLRGPVSLRSNFVHWCECARGQQAVAGTPECARVPPVL